MATAVAGAAMTALPAAAVPAKAGLPFPVIGGLLVAASLVGPLSRWPPAGGLAAVAAVAQCAAAGPAPAVLAAEGLLILAYLVLLDWPAGLAGPAAGQWLRRQAPAAGWAAAACAVVAIVLVVPVPASAWLVVAGVAAAVTAAAIAVPRLRRTPHDDSGESGGPNPA